MPPPTSSWIERFVQLLHDPPGKIRYLRGHEALAKRLADELAGVAFTQEDWDALLVPRADRAAAGADRPSLPFGVRQWMSRAETLVVTHPLGDRSICPPLRLGHADGSPVTQTKAPAVGKQERGDQLDAARALARELVGGDAEARYYAVWRRLRDDLITTRDPQWAQPDAHAAGDAFWSLLPADSRCPDVSIWDHTRVTAGLSFMTGAGDVALPPERQPYLLKLSLTPVQSFIGMARTSRDLWLGSMLIAELAFRAMTPFLDQYGPTAILYPDLRANPRMDQWLKERHFVDALPARGQQPSSFAALVPNAFVAVVPRGRDGDAELPSLESLAAEAATRVERGWRDVASIVREWMTQTIGAGGAWEAIWDRQHAAADVIRVRWTAVPWLAGDRIEEPGQPDRVQRTYRFGPIFPFSQLSAPAHTESPVDIEVREARERRLRPWVPAPLWNHSETTRSVFAHANPNIHHSERGFDFAVTHAMLRSVHDARKQVASWPRATVELGVKCTLCGQRSALTGAPTHGPRIDGLTESARDFWSAKALDPDETGGERLCAICAMRRFAVEADRGFTWINKLWATDLDRAALAREPGGKPRVPFPSTSAIAAQNFLLELARRATPRIIRAADQVVSAHGRAGLVQTQFPRALVRLRLAEMFAAERDRSGALERLLRIEPQECLYLDALQAQLGLRARRAGDQPPTEHPLLEAVTELLDAARDDLGLQPPASRIAVMKLDGDSLGQLIDGDPGRIGTHWADVLHPATASKVRADARCQQAGWSLLLDAPRMTGPSLHAFISRALGELAHRIVPWVVECEYAGRLIYAGGDDVLALVPADDALGLAARLQQLYSAHWVVDTQHEEDAWFWRREPSTTAAMLDGRLRAARDRFVIPVPQPGADHVTWPPSRRAPHTTDKAPGVAVPIVDVAGPVIPMLGSRQSISAGIVYAHIKDGLGGLVGEAGRALDKAAKAVEDKAAVALVDRTRGGTKRTFAMRWNPDGRDPLGLPAAHRLLTQVKEAFSSGELPSRLPYKLREVARALEPIFDVTPARILADEDGKAPLLRNSILANLEDDTAPDLIDAVVTLWRAGWRGHQARRAASPADAAAPSQVDHTLDGLLIALALADQEDA